MLGLEADDFVYGGVWSAVIFAAGLLLANYANASPLGAQNTALRIGKVVFVIVSFINIALFISLLYVLGGRPLVAPSGGWNWTDFLTVQLGVVTIVLAVLALFVGIAAIWGYSTIRGGAETASQQALSAYLMSSDFKLQLAESVQNALTAETVRAHLNVQETQGEASSARPEMDWED